MKPMDNQDKCFCDRSKSVTSPLSVREPLRAPCRPSPHSGPTMHEFAVATPSSKIHLTNDEVRVHPHRAQSTKFEASFTAAPPTSNIPSVSPLKGPRNEPSLHEPILFSPDFPRAFPGAWFLSPSTLRPPGSGLISQNEDSQSGMIREETLMMTTSLPRLEKLENVQQLLPWIPPAQGSSPSNPRISSPVATTRDLHAGRDGESPLHGRSPIQKPPSGGSRERITKFNT